MQPILLNDLALEHGDRKLINFHSKLKSWSQVWLDTIPGGILQHLIERVLTECFVRLKTIVALVNERTGNDH